MDNNYFVDSDKLSEAALEKKHRLENDPSSRTDHMQYMEGMEQISSDIRERVISEMQSYDYSKYTPADVLRALRHDTCSVEDFKALLSPAAEPFLEQMAERARLETQKHFGNTVYLFTPLYIANYCENYCVYCGFNCYNDIRRMKLSMEQIEHEMKVISESGMEEILILTGESRAQSSVEYIGEACKLARKYFRLVGIEIYPVNTDEYRYLHECGVDYVTVFQETYNRETYKKVHLAGQKRIFSYRLNAQERAIQGGMRGVGFGALLGIDDFRRDAFSTGVHASLLQKKYPHAEIAVSVPRLRPFVNNAEENPGDVHEKELLQIMCAHRLMLPYASITISTRERAEFRDNAVKIAATKISAGVCVGIGGRGGDEKGDEQFEISDPRSVEEITAALHKNGLQPSFNEYIRLI